MSAMRQKILTWLEQELAAAARIYLRRTRPEIIGITGSAGKTTTKELIACLVAPDKRLRVTKKSLNTPLGLALTVLGLPHPDSLLGWLNLPFSAWLRAYTEPAVDCLVLEYGVDAPGDMAALLKIARPRVAVFVTVLPIPAHMDAEHGQFATPEEVAKEKAELLLALPKDGLAVINADVALVRRSCAKTPARTVTFGSGREALVQAKKVNLAAAGLALSIRLPDRRSLLPIQVPLLGRQFVPAILASIVVARELGVSAEAIAERLARFPGTPGRLQRISGKRQMTLLDDSYNASPGSMVAALDSLVTLPATGRRVAVLGNMNELGAYAKAGHAEVGQAVAEMKPDSLITIGERGQWIAEAAIEHGFSAGKHRHFATPEEAILELPRLLKAKDTVLVKASQNGMRLERLVKVLMKNPADAARLLTRQGRAWDRP